MSQRLIEIMYWNNNNNNNKNQRHISIDNWFVDLWTENRDYNNNNRLSSNTHGARYIHVKIYTEL